MDFIEFRKSYGGLYICSHDVDGQMKWHHFQNTEDLSMYVQDEFADALFEKLNSQQTHSPNSDSITLQEQNHELLDQSILFEVLAQASNHMMVINFNEITLDDWNQLLQPEVWKSQMAFDYWLKITQNRAVSTLISELKLTKFDVMEIFSVKARVVNQWINTGVAPSNILKYLIAIDQSMDSKAREWMQYIEQQRKLMGNPEIIGLPVYNNFADYHECEEGLLDELPLLTLHQAFIERLMKLLKQKEIESSTVELSVAEYHSWLKENDFLSSPGARISFATSQVNKLRGINNGRK